MTPANISILVAPPSAPPPAAPLSAFPPTIPPPAAPPPFCVDAEYTGFVDAVTTMPLTCDDLREFNGCDPEEDYSEQIREKCPIACGLCTPPPAPPQTPPQPPSPPSPPMLPSPLSPPPSPPTPPRAPPSPPSPPMSPSPQSPPPCQDNSPTGLVFSNGEPARCDQLMTACEHSSYGELIRERCRRTCGVCVYLEAPPSPPVPPPVPPLAPQPRAPPPEPPHPPSPPSVGGCYNADGTHQCDCTTPESACAGIWTSGCNCAATGAPRVTPARAHLH